MKGGGFRFFRIRSGFLDWGSKSHSIHRTSFKAHHILCQGSRFVREDILNSTKITNDGASCDCSSVCCVIVHVFVTVYEPKHTESYELNCNVETQRNQIVEQRNIQAKELNPRVGGSLPNGRVEVTREVGPFFACIRVETSIPEVIELFFIFYNRIGSQVNNGQCHDT